MSGVLTAEERRRFCQYLRQEIKTGEGMIEHFEKMSRPELLVNRERTRILGCSIVLQNLLAAEEFTLSRT